MANLTIPNTDLNIPQVEANDATLATILSAVFVVIGGISVLYLLFAAFRYITVSQGGKGEKIAVAKNSIVYAVIGLVVSLLAFTIVQFVLGSIFG